MISLSVHLNFYFYTHFVENVINIIHGWVNNVDNDNPYYQSMCMSVSIHDIYDCCRCVVPSYISDLGAFANLLILSLKYTIFSA